MLCNCMVAIPCGAALDLNMSNLNSDFFSIVGALRNSGGKKLSYDYMCLKNFCLFKNKRFFTIPKKKTRGN